MQGTGDSSWACAPVYEDPVLASPVDLADPDYWCGLLSLSDEDLFNFALPGPIGTYCHVINPEVGACDYYVRGSKIREADYTGIPFLSTTLTGTGCVDTRGTSSCYYQSSSYDLTQEERDSMCTTSVVANAAAQLRYGIMNGRCMDDPNYFTPCVSRIICAPFSFFISSSTCFADQLLSHSLPTGKSSTMMISR